MIKKYSENYIFNELRDSAALSISGVPSNIVRGVIAHVNLERIKEYGSRAQILLRVLRSLSNQQIKLGKLTFNYFGPSRSKIKKSHVHGSFKTCIYNTEYCWELLGLLNSLILPYYYSNVSFRCATKLKGNVVIFRLGKLKKIWDTNYNPTNRKTRKIKKTDVLRIEIVLNPRFTRTELDFIYRQLIIKPNALSAR
jgi:hypothetical protein